MRWVPGVSIGEEGGLFWPWHRDKEGYFRIGHHRIGANVVTTCRDCGVVLAAGPAAKGRKSAAVTQHDNLHRQIENLQDQMAYLYERLGIEAGDQDGDDSQSTESGYIEPGYDVRDLGSEPDRADENG